MKKLVLALATTALTSTAAFAEGSASFEGPFIGASIGVGQTHGKATHQVTTIASGVVFSKDTNDLSTLGVLGGLHLGWDKIVQNKWLLGLEVYGDLSSLNGKHRTELAGLVGDLKADSDWSVGANLRLGTLIKENILAYLALGWVGSEWEMKIKYQDNAQLSAKADEFLSGFRVGLGMATMLTDHMMFGIEAAYTWYEDFDKSIDMDLDQDGTKEQRVRLKYDPELLEARMKLSWKIKGAF